MVESTLTNTSVEGNPAPTPGNATMLQAFEWYSPAGGKHWKRLATILEDLSKTGITSMWIPPACKASSKDGNGYDVYDLWDLGEFDQKGQVETKWGTKNDLLTLVKQAREHGIGLIFDAVLNHKAAADELEKCRAQEVDSDDRTKTISDPYEINGWLGFTFPGRGDKYSNFKWHWSHFTGTDYNDDNQKSAIYKILGDGKGWAEDGVDTEKGNFDYLMFADIDHSHPEVAREIKNWGAWVTKELGLVGFRFDAVKHFSEDFLRDFIDHVQEENAKSKDGNKAAENLFCVGEFWKMSVQDMMDYIERMGRKFSLFDAPLVNNFSSLSKQEKSDLRTVFDNTLTKCEPVNSCTLVTNHDTQPGQALEIPIEGFFKPLAYSLILLRAEGYPCVFLGDLYGTAGPEDGEPASCGGQLGDLILARKQYAYGQQDDYFDFPTCIGWVRKGTWDKPDGLACVLSNAEAGQKRMHVGELHAGEKWTDVLGWSQGEVTIGDDGFGEFYCPGVSVSVWVNKDAEGRENFGEFKAEIDGLTKKLEQSM